MKNTIKKFIYGAGKYGQLLLDCLKDCMEIDYFVQTEESTVREVKGVPVISYEEMMAFEGQKVVFIAISNKKTARQIERNIYVQDDSNIKVYQCSNFIHDNSALYNKRRFDLHGEKYCIICGNNFDTFLPAGIDEEIFKQHHIIGGGYRHNCQCPCCGSRDRERWLYYVLQNHTDISEISGRILHFAPEKSIIGYIEQNEKVDYYTGDIVSGKAMHIVDITDIQYKDNTFDYIISNHIMEHIADEKKAVSEIKRVLKKNGKWIFSFPICTDMKTYEDGKIISPEARLKEYGQEDHVRLYGYDYIERFENYGLELQIFSPQKELDHEHIKQYGFIEDDIIIIASKIKG